MKVVSGFLLFLGPVLTNYVPTILPVDCTDIHNQDNNKSSGVYTIYPVGATSGVQVYCEMNSEEQWTVFQRRMDGSVNFYRPWDQYRMGFGNAAGEYWLGLENLFYMTLNKTYELLVDMEDFSRKKAFARYSSFSVDPEFHGYRLNVYGFTDGGAGDSLSSHNRQRFSTFDIDRDASRTNCAKEHLGAFWYASCQTANPNGVYVWGRDNTHYGVGVSWYTWKGWDYSLKSISMKIHPVEKI